MTVKRKVWLVTGVISLFLLVMLLSIALGSTVIPFSHVAAYGLSHIPGIGRWIVPNWTDSEAMILAHIRIPRTFMGFIIGASLSLAGCGYQGVLRNPLADPYILGISAGASVGAAGMILLSGDGHPYSLFAIPLAAFVGACAALWLVLLLAAGGPVLRVETLILAGVVVNALFGAVLTLILWLTPGNAAQQILWWMIGSLSLRDWHYTWVSLPLLVFAWAYLSLHARELNALALGELQAESLGVRVERVKWGVLLVSSLVAASAVAVAGIIGFVGLVVPHVVRLTFGGDHRWLVHFAAIGGGIFLVFCDMLARVILAPEEMSIGVVTALLGAPFFAYLLRSRERGGKR